MHGYEGLYTIMHTISYTRDCTSFYTDVYRHASWTQSTTFLLHLGDSQSKQLAIGHDAPHRVVTSGNIVGVKRVTKTNSLIDQRNQRIPNQRNQRNQRILDFLIGIDDFYKEFKIL